MINNGPLNMYATRQIVEHDFSVELPSCMYQMKNIHQTRRNGNVIKTPNHVHVGQKNLDISEQNNQSTGMAELVCRQEKILLKLEDLKKQMLAIRKELNAPNVKECSLANKTYACPAKINIENMELVINANPNNPPYSLNLLASLLKDKIHLNLNVHIHSSIKNRDSIKSFELPNTTQSNNLPAINLRLIWKDVGVHIVTTTVEGVQLIGEVNMLRYLARMGYFNYENLNAFEIDSLLDTCHCISSAATKTERSSLLRLLPNKFDKTASQLSIADLAIYATVKQLGKNEVNSSMTKMIQHLEAF